MAIKGVILDVDGTFVLSNDAHASAWVEAFAEHGYEVSFEHVRSLIGMGGDKIIPKLVPGLNDENGVGKAISDRRKEVFLQTYAPKLVAAKGGRELVERMHADGLELVIASSAKSDELETLLQAAHIDDLVQEATTSSDAEESKPSPDIVEAALRKIGFDPSEMLMIGDTPYDIESARKLGIDVLAVRCGGWNDEDLADALAVYEDPHELLMKYADSPLARSG